MQKALNKQQDQSFRFQLGFKRTKMVQLDYLMLFTPFLTIRTHGGGEVAAGGSGLTTGMAARHQPALCLAVGGVELMTCPTADARLPVAWLTLAARRGVVRGEEGGAAAVPAAVAALPFGQGLGLKGSPLRRTSVSSVTAQLGAILRPGNHRIVTT